MNHYKISDTLPLQGRVALVTGGSRGIGAAIARRLAADGADIALTFAQSAEKAQSVANEIQTLGRRGVAIAADNAEPSAVTRAVERVIAELGHLDILVNNASVFHYGPLESVTLADLDRLLAVNVRAAFLAAQAAAPHLPAGGRIVTIGSCLAERVPNPGLTLYALTKTALIGLTKGLARDLGPRGITANLVHPGPTDTDMNPATGPAADGQRAQLATGKYAEPDEIARVVAFLASPASQFITGAAWSVDGGFSA